MIIISAGTKGSRDFLCEYRLNRKCAMAMYGRHGGKVPLINSALPWTELLASVSGRFIPGDYGELNMEQW
jgi:hypothetical protein